MQEKIDDLNTKYEECNRELSSKKGKLKELQSLCERYEEEIRDLGDRDKEMEDLIKAAVDKNQKIMEERDDLQEKLKDKNKQTSEFIIALEQGEQRIDELEKINNELRAEIIKYEGQMNLYKDIELHNTEGDVEKNKLTKQNSNLMTRLDELQKMIENLSNQKIELVKKTQSLQNSLNNSISQNSSYNKELEIKYKDLKKENQLLKVENVKYYNQLNHLEKKYEYLKGVNEGKIDLSKELDLSSRNNKSDLLLLKKDNKNNNIYNTTEGIDGVDGGIEGDKKRKDKLKDESDLTFEPPCKCDYYNKYMIEKEKRKKAVRKMKEIRKIAETRVYIYLYNYYLIVY